MSVALECARDDFAQAARALETALHLAEVRLVRVIVLDMRRQLGDIASHSTCEPTAQDRLAGWSAMLRGVSRLADAQDFPQARRLLATSCF